MTPKPWPWWQKATGSDQHRAGQLLSGIWPLHAQSQHVWTWRGQADARHDITPGIHSRIAHSPGVAVTDDLVKAATRDLIDKARTAELDRHEGIRLPDIALLAMLQHHGAATPLLDVSLDPLVALYMAIEGPEGVNTDEDGVLFAIKRPSRVYPSFVADRFEEIYDRQAATTRADFYNAPPVSDRLLIQRGAWAGLTSWYSSTIRWRRRA